MGPYVVFSRCIRAANRAHPLDSFDRFQESDDLKHPHDLDNAQDPAVAVVLHHLFLLNARLGGTLHSVATFGTRWNFQSRVQQ